MKIISNIVLIMIFICSIAYAIDDASLVLYCPFDEGKGDTIKDAKSGLVGKISGPQWTAKGKIGGALEFISDADKVEFAAEDKLDITDAITMEAWVLPNKVQGDSSIMGRRSNPNVGGYCMQWTAGKFEMWLNVNGGGWQGTRDKQKIIPNPGEWHHIACVYDGNDEMQYVDGVLDVKFTAAGKIASIKEVFRIGQAQTNLASMLGFIDEVAVYKRALTFNEIKKDMSEGVISSVSPAGNLVSAWGSIKNSR
jgi:hypothetical protein